MTGNLTLSVRPRLLLATHHLRRPVGHSETCLTPPLPVSGGVALVSTRQTFEPSELVAVQSLDRPALRWPAARDTCESWARDSRDSPPPFLPPEENMNRSHWTVKGCHSLTPSVEGSNEWALCHTRCARSSVCPVLCVLSSLWASWKGLSLMWQ